MTLRFTSIFPRDLMRLIWRLQKRCSQLMCHTAEDFERDPFLIPTALRRIAHPQVRDGVGSTRPSGRRHLPFGKSVMAAAMARSPSACAKTQGIKKPEVSRAATRWPSWESGVGGSRRSAAHARVTGGPRNALCEVTRPLPDQKPAPWLIRLTRLSSTDKAASFARAVPLPKSLAVAEKFDATAFDEPGAPWTHEGAFCSFDALLDGFGLRTDALDKMARVIRGADTNDHALAPEAAGLLALSVGLSRAFSDDLEQLEAGPHRSAL